jgi:uncharacterized protein
MATGLIALLDDVAALTRLAAASLDDVALAAGKASKKAIGIVIDDAAVTPRYVVGLEAARELPIIAKIARGSLINKLLILLPGALALSALAPWAITPLLMLGGLFLCYEATHKVMEVLHPHPQDKQAGVAEPVQDAASLEKAKIASAVRTDFILSAEIMAIALADITDQSIATQAAILFVVGVGITVGVYGVVALIVKMDDFGMHLAYKSQAMLQAIGRSLVRAMPYLMQFLSVVGTAAMAWVGGGILLHGLEHYHLQALPHFVHALAKTISALLPIAQGVLAWLVSAFSAAVVGLVAGGLVIVLLKPINKVFNKG